MANQTEIEAHYDTIGTLHALRLKEVQEGFPDYTCAFFDGDFTKTLKQAQEDKHAWIFDRLGVGQDLRGKRILDIGCGWGPILHAVRKRGGEGVGLTLSSGQQRYCAAQGLNVRLLDYKHIKKGELGTFDGVVSVGSAEAYCSVEEYLTGKQEKIYRNFFESCANMLVPHGRLFVQTMTWGTHVPDYHKFSLNAPPHSEEAILARMEKFYPGSWPPNDLAQMIKTAEPYFTFLKTNNGRLDYLETLKHWGASSKNLLKPSIFQQALKATAVLLWKTLTDSNTRVLMQSFFFDDQGEAFRKEILNHERMFFEKR